MENEDIAKSRLRNQLIAASTVTKPEDVVRHMGAMQAQDYLGALWAIGLRMKSSSAQQVEQTLLDGRIVRTWPMRRTLHFVASEDAKWMLQLTSPRLIAGSKGRLAWHGLTEDDISKSRKIITKALQNKKALTREELYGKLKDGGISLGNNNGLHILWRIAQEGTTCFGPRREKQQTFVLFDEWVKKSKDLEGDEALAELTLRYFTSHGPATIHDFMWWSGLTSTDTKKGIELNKIKLTKETIEGKEYILSPTNKIGDSLSFAILPPFDEYLVAYKNRDAVLEVVHKQKVNPGSNGMFSPIIVVNGQVVGTWRRKVKKKGVELMSHPFSSKVKISKKEFKKAGNQYSKFLGFPF